MDESKQEVLSLHKPLRVVVYLGEVERKFVTLGSPYGVTGSGVR